MKEGTVLEHIRRYALWVTLGSAAVALVIGLLVIWGVVELIDTSGLEDALAAFALLSQLGDLGMMGDAGAMGDFGELGDLGALGAMDGSSMFGGSLVELTVWAKLLMTTSALLATAGTTLLSLLVASHVKKGDK